MNGFKVSSRKLDKLLVVLIVIQLAVLAMVGLALVDIDIPVARQIVIFTYLCFVPGFLIVRLFQLHNSNLVEGVLYSVGLSVALLMFLGLFINWLLPFLGIERPLSTMPILVAVVLVTGLLSYIVYRHGGFGRVTVPAMGRCLSPPALVLYFLPLFAVLATLFRNQFDNSILEFVLLGLIVLLAILAAFGKFITREFYPLAAYCIALALLFHRSLVSMYLIGWDVRFEYLMYSQVVQKGLWSSTTILSTYNSVLSVTILPTIFSLLLGMEGTWIFKILFPVLFALVPLGAYRLVEKQVDGKLAFLSVFFLVSYSFFFSSGVEMGKLNISVLFMSLLLLLMVSSEMNRLARAAMAIIFLGSMVVSHYATAYLFAVLVLLAWAAMEIIKRILPGKFGTKSIEGSLANINVLTGTFLTLTCVLVIAWYMYTTHGVLFRDIVNMGEQMFTSFISDLLRPETRELSTLQEVGLAPYVVTSLPRNIARWISHVTRGLIVIGFIGWIVNGKRARFTLEFVAMSVIGLALLGACIVVPHFSPGGVARLYFIALLLLAPFCILGWEVIFSLFKLLRLPVGQLLSTALLMLLLITYFLANTGFLFEMTGDVPTSISLSPTLDWAYFTRQEEQGAAWLSDNIGASMTVYTDANGYPLFLAYHRVDAVGLGRVSAGFKRIYDVPPGVYIFLRGNNIRDGKVLVPAEVRGGPIDYVPIEETVLLEKRNKVYASGGSEIYK